MTARLISITWLRDRDYETVFHADGEECRTICTVTEARGIPLVNDHPPLLVSLGIATRLVAAAVVAVDSARTDEKRR